MTQTHLPRERHTHLEKILKKYFLIAVTMLKKPAVTIVVQIEVWLYLLGVKLVFMISVLYSLVTYPYREATFPCKLLNFLKQVIPSPEYTNECIVSTNLKFVSFPDRLRLFLYGRCSQEAQPGKEMKATTKTTKPTHRQHVHSQQI